MAFAEGLRWAFRQVTFLSNQKAFRDFFQCEFLLELSANFPVEVVRSLPSDFATGIYCGWAQVDSGDVHKMVMSVGWNPFFDNKEKSMVREWDVREISIEADERIFFSRKRIFCISFRMISMIRP